MFLQILTEHQGHLLVRAAVSIVVLAALLLLVRFFNRRQTKTKSPMTGMLNFDEPPRRPSKKRRSINNRNKRKK